MLVVETFAGVLFEMQPLDADNHPLAAEQVNDDFALADYGAFVL